MSGYLRILILNIIFAVFLKSMTIFLLQKYRNFRKITVLTSFLTSPILTTLMLIIIGLTDNMLIVFLLFFVIEHILMLTQAYIFYLCTNEELTKCIKVSLFANILPIICCILCLGMLFLFHVNATPPQPPKVEIYY